MDKEKIIAKTEKALTGFETENVIALLKDLSLKTVLENQAVCFILGAVLIYALLVRSRFIILFIFALVSVLMLIRYTLPDPGTVMTVSNTIPFAFGLLAIGAILLYFIFLKAE